MMDEQKTIPAPERQLQEMSKEDFVYVDIALNALNRAFHGELKSIPTLILRDFIFVATAESNRRKYERSQKGD